MFLYLVQLEKDMDIEQALLNTVIAFKLMQYSYSLKSFFKDEFKRKNGYIIPFSHILYFKRHVFPIIRDACEFVCPNNDDQCSGHRLINFVEKFYEFEKHAVLDEKYFFRYFYFYNFKIKKDEENNVEKVVEWEFNSFATKDLSKLSFSQRCQYLN